MGYPRLQERSSRDSTPADPKAGWQTGFNQSCGSDVNICRHMLSWAVLLGRKIKDWKSSKKLSCENIPQGMAALFVWENQDLSGHERKRRF